MKIDRDWDKIAKYNFNFGIIFGVLSETLLNRLDYNFFKAINTD